MLNEREVETHIYFDFEQLCYVMLNVMFQQCMIGITCSHHSIKQGKIKKAKWINSHLVYNNAALQEMLDIMKSIYDMMGKYTYPTMQDDAPRDHVESFFQVNLQSLTLCIY